MLCYCSGYIGKWNECKKTSDTDVLARKRGGCQTYRELSPLYLLTHCSADGVQHLLILRTANAKKGKKGGKEDILENV